MTILLQDKPGPARPDVRGLPATFGSLGVPAPLVAPLDAAGITVPVPIQAAALSDALGRISRSRNQGAEATLAMISVLQQGRRLDAAAVQ